MLILSIYQKKCRFYCGHNHPINCNLGLFFRYFTVLMVKRSWLPFSDEYCIIYPNNPTHLLLHKNKPISNIHPYASSG